MQSAPVVGEHGDLVLGFLAAFADAGLPEEFGLILSPRAAGVNTRS